MLWLDCDVSAFAVHVVNADTDIMTTSTIIMTKNYIIQHVCLIVIHRRMWFLISTNGSGKLNSWQI